MLAAAPWILTQTLETHACLVAVQNAEIERDESKLTIYLHDLNLFFTAQVRSSPSSAVLTSEFYNLMTEQSDNCACTGSASVFSMNYHSCNIIYLFYCSLPESWRFLWWYCTRTRSLGIHSRRTHRVIYFSSNLCGWRLNDWQRMQREGNGQDMTDAGKIGTSIPCLV